eukprot:4474251-Pleurochrysis_carterae.AAC.1
MRSSPTSPDLTPAAAAGSPSGESQLAESSSQGFLNEALADSSRRSSVRRAALAGPGHYFTARGADGSEALSMLRCESFLSGAAGSGVPGTQPFSLRIDPLVLALTDFHAHLLNVEIIGARRWAT